MGNPTGRPNGRPPGRKNAATLQREQHKHRAITAALGTLTEEQIQALLPKDILRIVAHAAVRTNDIPLMLKAAAEWGPYEHPKLSSETLNVRNDDSKRSDDDIRREIAELERLAKASRIEAGTVAPGMSEEPDRLVH